MSDRHVLYRFEIPGSRVPPSPWIRGITQGAVVLMLGGSCLHGLFPNGWVTLGGALALAIIVACRSGMRPRSWGHTRVLVELDRERIRVERHYRSYYGLALEENTLPIGTITELAWNDESLTASVGVTQGGSYWLPLLTLSDLTELGRALVKLKVDVRFKGFEI
jgi:hypothetical protein